MLAISLLHFVSSPIRKRFFAHFYMLVVDTETIISMTCTDVSLRDLINGNRAVLFLLGMLDMVVTTYEKTFVLQNSLIG